MQIEIWSDFVCPFCYIGKRRLEQALKQLPAQTKVELVYRSFELDPHADKHKQVDVVSMLSAKYGMSMEQAKANTDNLVKQAATVGLSFHFDQMKHTNTFDAHRLAHWAGKYDKMNELAERLLKAYFTDGANLGDAESLAALAGELGLDQKEAAAVLAGNDYTDQVRADQARASQIGITGVPFFVFNNKYAISGAQPEEVFLEALQKIAEEEKPLTILNAPASVDADDSYCADGSCNVPLKADK